MSWSKLEVHAQTDPPQGSVAQLIEHGMKEEK